MKERHPSTASGPRISIIIPTLNGGLDFQRCLESIKKQEGCGSVELIVLDSASEDETRRHAAEAGAKVIEIDRSAFNHGKVRDLGARNAQGEFYVFTVQDARPADPHWLGALVRPLLDGAAGSTSRILPRPEANPLARRTVLDSPLASEAPFEANPDKLNLKALCPEALLALARFDDVSSSIRADVYGAVPFRERAMGEDLAWAVEALGKGYRLAFAPDSVIYHSHEYTSRMAFQRYKQDAQALLELIGFRVRPNLLHLLKGYVYEVARDVSFLLRCGPGTLLRYGLQALVLRGYQVAGQWRGSR